MAGAVNVQVTIDAKDNGAAAQLLALKQAAGQLGLAFNVATSSSEKLGASGLKLGRDFSGAIAGAIEGATGLRTVLAQVALGYEAIHAARSFLEEGFTATSGLEQAALGIGSEVAGNATIAGPGGEAIDGAEKLALATAEGRRQMELLGQASHAVGIEATSLAEIFTKSVGPALRGGGNLANLRQETVQLALLAQQLGIPYEKVSATLLQILNGHAQQRNQLVAILGISQQELTQAAQRGKIQDLLNAKLAKFGDLAAQGEDSLRRIGERLKTTLEEAAVTTVEPIVTVIEQKIGPALSHLDLSGLTGALQGVAAQIGELLGSAFNKAVAGAKELQTWLAEHQQTVRETLANLGQVAAAVGAIVSGAAQMAAEFVNVGVNAGVIAGAARTLAATVPVLATIWAVSRVAAFASAINGVGVALVAAGTKVAGFIGFLNTVRTAGLAAGLGITATGVAAEGAIAPVTALGVAISLAAPILTVLALALTGAAIAWNAHRANVEAAAQAQREENEAIGKSLSLAPSLIDQLHEQEQAYRRAAAGSAEQHEAERQIAEIRQQLLALSPSFKGALDNETLSIDGQTEALKRNVAALALQADAKERAAEQRVVEAERALAEAQAAHPAGQGATAGNFLTGGPQGAGIAADADDQEVKDLTKKRNDALADLTATRQAVHPAIPQATAEDTALAAVKQREDAKRAIVDEQYARGEIDAQKHQQRLNDIEFQGAREQIKIHEDALSHETDSGRRKQEVDAINALRGRQLDLVRERGTTELPAGKDHSAQDATSDAELIRKQAEDRTKVLDEHYRTEQADATRSYAQQIADIRDYYSQRATIEYDALGREIAVKESLLSKATDTSERHRLVNEITGLEADQQNVVAISTEKQIQDLDKLEKKRQEVARTSIGEQQTQIRDTLTSRVEDIHAETDAGTITKAQAAQQLSAAYADALDKERQLYAVAVQYAATYPDDQRLAGEVQNIAKAYSQVQLEAAKAAEASNELGKALGDALEHSFDEVFGGGIDKMRRFSDAVREMALGIAKDLQHAFAATEGKNIKTAVERIFAPKVPDKDRQPIDASSSKLTTAGDAMASAAAAWKRVADQFARMGLPSGAAPSSARTTEAPAAQRGNVTQGGVGTVSPEGETIAPPGAPIAPTLGTLGGDAGLGSLVDPNIHEWEPSSGMLSIAPTIGAPGGDAGLGVLPPDLGAPDNGSAQYAGGSGGSSGALKSVTGIAGIASQIGGLLPGGAALSKGLGLASSIGNAAERVAGAAGVPGLPGAAGGGSGSGALSAAAAALQSVAAALSGAAGQLTQSAQQLAQAASAISSGAGGAAAGASPAAGLAGALGPAASLMVSRGGHIQRLASGGQPRRYVAPILKAAAGLFALHLAMGGPAKAESPAHGWAARLAPAVHAFARGGPVSGAGTATSDSIPAMLSHGEYVVKAASVAKVGVPTMHAINAGSFTRDSHNSIRTFATGGLVSGSSGNAARGSEHHVVEVRPPEGWVAKEMESPEGQNAHVRISTRNARSVKAGLGIG